MSASERARSFVAQHDLTEHVATVVASAPPLPEATGVVWRSAVATVLAGKQEARRRVNGPTPKDRPESHAGSIVPDRCATVDGGVP